MNPHKRTRPPAKSGHMEGWRLWLCLGVLVITLLTLQQAQKLEPKTDGQHWLITLEAPLPAEQEATFKRQLNELRVLQGQPFELRLLPHSQAPKE